MLQWIVSSSVLILVMIGLRFLLRGRVKPVVQYALWALVLVRLLLPVQLGSTQISLQNSLEKAPVVQQMELADKVEAFVYHEGSGAEDSYYEYQPPAYIPPVNEVLPPENVQPQAPVQPAPQVFTPQEVEVITRVGDVKDVLTWIWVGGMIAMGLVFVAANLRFALQVKNAKREENEGKIPVFVTDKVDTPCLFGLLRPAVYLPPEVAAEPCHRAYSVAHELTHYRHGDALWAVLRCVCIVVHWYNPLVWWAAILSREDGEIACDEATIARLGQENRADYGRVLVDLTCRKRTDLFQTATTMTGSAKGLTQRIKMIVKQPKTAVYALVILILVGGLVVGCTFTGSKPGDTDTPDSTESTDSTDSTESNGNNMAFTATKGDLYQLPYDLTDAKALTDAELAEFQALFQPLTREDGGTNWYNLLLFCGSDITYANGFRTPKDVDLTDLFNNGFRSETPGIDKLTAEEVAFLEQTGRYTPELDLYRLPAQRINQVLKTYMGITLANIPEDHLETIKYMPETDCYYLHPAGAAAELNFQFTYGEREADGTVHLLCVSDRGTTYETRKVIQLTPAPEGNPVPYYVRSCREPWYALPGYGRLVVYDPENPDFGSAEFGQCTPGALYYRVGNRPTLVTNEPVSLYYARFGTAFFVKTAEPTKLYAVNVKDIPNTKMVYESNYGPITKVLHDFCVMNSTAMVIEDNKRLVMLDLTAGTAEVVKETYYLEDADIRVFYGYKELPPLFTKTWKEADYLVLYRKENEDAPLTEKFYVLKTETPEAGTNQYGRPLSWGDPGFDKAPSHLFPFIYPEDGSLDDIIGQNDCKPGYLYVKNRNTGEITQMLIHSTVTAFVETYDYLYCANSLGQFYRMDYAGTEKKVLYAAPSGKIFDLILEFNRLYMLEADRILQWHMYDDTIKVVVQGDSYASMHLLSDQMMIFETTDGKQYSMRVGNVSKWVKYDPDDCTLVATQDQMDALIKNAHYYKLIQSNFWYQRAFGCAFEKPEDISAELYFYIGLEEKDEQNPSTFTDEEKAYLQERSLHGGISNFNKMPVAKMNEALSVLNITVEDLKIPDNFIYYDKTDSYYVEHTDAYIPERPFVTAVVENTDGTVQVYWEAEWIHWDRGNAIQDAKMVTTMQKLNDGTYRILSNVPVQ